MPNRLKLVLYFSLLALVFTSVAARPVSYRDFFLNYVEVRSNRMREDVAELSKLMDSLNNEKISRAEAVARTEEMESRADSYLARVLELRPPEGEFENYENSVYSFVTWRNVLGLYVEGLTDMNNAKLDAAEVLLEHLEKVG